MMEKKLDAKEARVALGKGYSGIIPVANVSWARKPNPKVAGIYAPAVKDARLVLSPGDLIWVSAAPRTVTVTNAKGRKEQRSTPFDAAEVKKLSLIHI